MSEKVALIILDGWGIGDRSSSDAIANANTPFFNSLIKKYPHASLKTSGEDVGLPAGQMGNSEVGHLNIGAGRVVYQDLVKINLEVRDNKIDDNSTWKATLAYCKGNDKPLHLMGLLSDGGVHSHEDHLHALIRKASEAGVNKIYVHCFTDGRDTDPKGGAEYLRKLSAVCNKTNATIATIIGRYYAMDRDKRWERIKLAYDLLIHGKGEVFNNPVEALEASYKNDITDEFVKPVIIESSSTIKEGDAVVCFNFRTDRCREITTVLTQKNMPEYDMKTLHLYYVTMTNYDDTFKNVKVMYDKDNLSKTLGEVIAEHGRKQIRIAETEKYPHVTFFFSGGREAEFSEEKRLLVPSPKVATYDLQPEMSAIELTQTILPEIEKTTADFICLNFANPDMVGHTGVFSAVIKAVETVDSCLEKIVTSGVKNDYSFIIIADHGNADFMINEDGTPNTAHTTNLVPCILIDKKRKVVRDGRLADIAPTILTLMNIPQPSEMTGRSLVD